MRSFALLLAAAVLAAPLLPAGARAQSVPVQVRMSTGTFLYDASRSVVEVYLSFGAASLAYAATDGGLAADLLVDVTLRPARAAAPGEAAAAPVATERLERRYVVADTSALTDGQVFVEQVRLAVPPGEYEVEASVQGTGARPFRAFELVTDVSVPAYAEGTAPRVSSLQLASAVARVTDATDPLAKSGLRIVPNPEAFYGEGRPEALAYVEVYRPPGATGGEYTLLTYLTEGGNRVALPGTESRLARAVRPVDPLVVRHDVSALPTGLYYLHTVVLDAANEAVAQSDARFFVINPHVARPDADVAMLTAEEAAYAVMGEEELVQNLEHARVIASARERAQIAPLLQDSAADDDRRAFLVRFWSERDTDPRPGVNAARRDFYQRLADVEARYGRGSRPGYRSDRGRIYLTYGAPSLIERRDHDPGTLPYEVWEYERIPGQGQAVFVFVDRYTAGELELVHSTVPGEVSLPDWERTIVIR